jgi:hypothetical protein
LWGEEDEDREGEPIVKRRVIVSSDRATLREIKNALHHIGGYEAFLRAAMNSENEADWWDLWGEIRRHLDSFSDRQALDDPGLRLLERHAKIVAAMNADPQFPYEFVFLGRDSLQVVPEDYRPHEFTPLQRWYLLGIESRHRCDRTMKNDDWKPPDEMEYRRPYRAGWTELGSDRDQWFPPKVPPRGAETEYVPEEPPMERTPVERREIHLSTDAMLADLCIAFPGGVPQLKIALHRIGAHVSAADIEGEVRTNGRVNALGFFRQRGLWEDWLRAHLGIHFEG